MEIRLTTVKLMEAVSAKTGVHSTNGLARLFGVSTGQIRNWRTGSVMQKIQQKQKAAELAGLDIMFVLVSLEAEEAERDGEHDVAASMYQKAQDWAPAAMSLTACLLIGFFHIMPFA
ncbi:hypothetical protein [Kistimonas asteriae]|uniref:hypothetical protein n=1 Tax=Kistimonas asteriae TaxID=517724 RepID=UPI001BA71A41|nr:hypothetical protein [Kistimonas asteriae]